MKPNNGWRWATGKRWEKSTTDGELCFGEDNLLEVVRAARLAGIHEDNWHHIQMERDYSECYYENDEPSITWRFPVSIFEE